MFKQFSQFLITEGNESNQAYGDAYEIGTILHLHNNTASKTNTHPDYKAKIATLKSKHKELLAALPEHMAQRAKTAAKDSANAYLQSLAAHRGIKPDHIKEIHHSNQGISKFIGRDVDRASNPHDIVIKGKVGREEFTHGASLKATSGTASNNPVGAFQTAGHSHGVLTNTSQIWSEGKKKAGLAGKSGKEIKAQRDDPKIKDFNRETQQAAANDHANAFHDATLKAQKQHLGFLLKSNPDLEYDYVKGEKGGSSVPHDQLPHIQAIKKAKSLSAEVKNNVVHFYDHNGVNVAKVEHRTTHGAFSSPQANAKFGTLLSKK